MPNWTDREVRDSFRRRALWTLQRQALTPAALKDAKGFLREHHANSSMQLRSHSWIHLGGCLNAEDFFFFLFPFSLPTVTRLVSTWPCMLTCVALFNTLEWKETSSRWCHCGQSRGRQCLKKTFFGRNQFLFCFGFFFYGRTWDNFKYLLFLLVHPFTMQCWMDYSFFFLQVCVFCLFFFRKMENLSGDCWWVSESKVPFYTKYIICSSIRCFLKHPPYKCYLLWNWIRSVVLILELFKAQMTVATNVCHMRY